MAHRASQAAALVTALLASSLRATLSYVECSEGFQGYPVLDGGRSELELADVNNDGNVDVLSIGDHGSPYVNTEEHGVMVWFGDGTGNWDLFQYGNFGYGGIAVGDVNGDGLWDVGYGMHHDYSHEDLGDQLIEVALGDGTGRFWTAWDDSLAQEGQDWGMFSTDLADIDNDGDLDVGSISFGADDGIHVYLNLGTGAWRRCFGFLGGNSRMEFYFRDVNRDGNADIIAAHGSGSAWFGDGRGGFTPASTGLPSSSYGLGGLSPGDADNDGGFDVSFVNDDGGVEVYVWDDGEQRWRDFSGSLPDTGQFQATALCDLNADGFIDICALGGGQLKVWIGDGLGSWTEAAVVTTPLPGTYSAFRTGADFDHNGLPDGAFITREGSWPNDINVAHAFREASPAESLAVFPVSPRGGENFGDGSVQFIDWWSEAPDAAVTRVRLELSTSGNGGPWSLIADSLRDAGRHQWTVPGGTTSGNCLIRYTVRGPSGENSALTSRPFAIGDTTVPLAEVRPPGNDCRMVVRPNPTRDWVLVELTTERDGIMRSCSERELRVFDVSGRLVNAYPAIGPWEGTSFRIRLGQLRPGVYLMVLRTDSARQAQTVVVL